MGARVRDRDRGLRRLVARLEQLAGAPARMTVGIHDDTGRVRHPTSRAPLAAVGSVLEYGSSKRAPLAWLRRTIDERRDAITRGLADAAARQLAGMSTAEAYAPLGIELVRAMRARVPVVTGTTAGAIEARVDGRRVSS
jgi:hypothetical protein